MVARVIKNELSVRATEEAVKTFLEPTAASDGRDDESDARSGLAASAAGARRERRRTRAAPGETTSTPAFTLT